MIVALSGRKSTGKTTLSELLISRGFKQVSFATPLKEYVAELFNWNLSDLYSQSGKEELLETPVVWDLDKCQKLEKIIGIKLNFINEVTFLTRRDALQYIGTDVLRGTDPDFHVNKFAEKFSEGNYVVDDLRFINELNVLKNMKAIIIHIIRPYNWTYSNHDSEISILRKDVEYLVINDTSHHKLIRKFNIFLDGLLSKRKKPISRSKLLEVLDKSNGDTTKAAKTIGCSRDKIVWWASKYIVNISRNSYDLNHDAFYTPDKESAYWAGVISADGTIKKHLKYDYLLELGSIDRELVEGFKNFLNTKKPIYTNFRDEVRHPIHSITISSPYIIDDLKRWNIEPKKSQNNQIPDCIKNNEELLCYWLVGLIDGDGSIYFIKKINNIGLTILASREIIDFINNWLNIPASIIQEKDIDNLWNLRFCGRNVVDLYNKIYRGMGLERKWNKVIPFLDRKWR